MSSDDPEKNADQDIPEDTPEPAPELESDAPDAEPSAADSVAGEPVGEAQSRRGGAFGVVVAIVLFLLLGAGAVYWQRMIHAPALAALDQRIAGFDAGHATLAADIAATRSELESIDSAATAAAADVAALGSTVSSTTQAQSDLQRSVSALYEKETQTSVDWVLAEAEYLVLAATQRLALERDIDTAVAALRAADQRLRSAEHPDLIPIRDQLIKDITELEGVNRADVEGLAIYLAKTIDQVDGLPTKPIAEEISPFATVRKGEYAAEDWRRLGYAIWSDLVDLVEVKDADLPDSVLFDPELRYFLQQNLRLELASARLAVLRRDKANLVASVGLVKTLLNAYYDENDAGVKSIIARLDEAATLELAPAMPNITGSLDVIRQQRGSRTADAGSAQ